MTKSLMTRGPRRRLWTLGLLLALGALGCDASDTPGDEPDTGGATSLDAGADAAADTGSTPTGPPSDGGAAPGERGVDFEASGAMTPGGLGSGATSDCNGALLAMGASTLDCDAAGCELSGACCSGSGSCCEAGDFAPAAPDWNGCNGPVEGCAGVTGQTFGSPRPTLGDGAISPLGDGDFDSGLVLDGVVDLRSTRLDLGIEFVVPTDCGPGCLEGAAVSLTTQDTFDDSTHVSTLAGLTMSGSRREVSLLVHDREVMRWPTSTATTWTLTVTPDGFVQVLGDGTALLEPAAAFEPAGAARVVIFGHDRNPAAGHEVAGVRTLSLTGSRCDIPTRWSAARDITLRERGAGVVSPSVDAIATTRTADGTLHAALLIDGNLHWAQQPGADATELTLTQSLDNPLFSPPDGTRLTSVALDTTDAGELVVLYGQVDEGGASIRRAMLGGASPSWAPTTLREGGSTITSFDALAIGRSSTGEVVLIARTADDSGPSTLRIYTLGRAMTGGSELTDAHLMSALSSSAAPGYDAVEIGDLALVGTNHAWQLYYARRSGARWSIGLLTSNDLVYWRHAADGDSVLRPDGGDHERVGVRAPAVDVRDGTVSLRYLGLDGAANHPRLVTRAATDVGDWIL